MFLIKCERASFSYDAHEALKDLNFEICAGDYVCVVGANGSGKSTLIKGLLGLKQPSSGNVFIGGQIKQNEIGYLPQSAPRQKDFPAGVYEVVLSGRLGQRGILPFYSKKDREIANENLKRLGLLTLKNRCFCELSGGQQ
ncbi:MAG: ATP-binding cassette domain-containing protein, partial [Endomicrobium sp.]|nr:ATP-binding cassette domain-containing protein [Endomicrobium sp.]